MAIDDLWMRADGTPRCWPGKHWTAEAPNLTLAQTDVTLSARKGGSRKKSGTINKRHE